MDNAIGIFYFSGTGNTKILVNLLEQALQAAQARVVESSGRMALSGGYNLQQIINNPNLPSKHLRPDMTGEFRRMYEYIYEQRW